MERGLSLLLGLPSSTSGKSYEIQAPTNSPNQARKLSMLTMGVTARITKRNQVHPSQQALEMTREIDRELVKITEQMPSTFWRPPIFADLKIDSVGATFEAQLLVLGTSHENIKECRVESLKYLIIHAGSSVRKHLILLRVKIFRSDLGEMMCMLLSQPRPRID